MIPDSDRRSPTYTGTGSVSAYAFTFKVFTDSDVQVIVADTGGVESLLVFGSGYTVTRNGDQETFPGGTINLTSPLALDYQLVVLGGVAYSQTSQLPTGGAYNATVVERALDRVTILVQQVKEVTKRVLALPAIEAAPLTLPAVPERANKFLAFDASGNPVAASGTTVAGTPISALGETLISRATAALMRGDLGAAAIDTQIGFTASCAASALTINLASQTLKIRNANLTNGGFVFRVAPASKSLVVSNGSTLGFTSAVRGRIAVLAVDDGVDFSLAVCNADTGLRLDETNLITTVAEGGAGAADSGKTIYSTSVLSNRPYRVLGYIQITQATAGVWVTQPELVQPIDSPRALKQLTPRFRATNSALRSTFGEAASYTEVLDTSDSFNPTNGRFTAPVRGLYFFEGAASASDLSYSSALAFLRIDGNPSTNQGEGASGGSQNDSLGEVPLPRFGCSVYLQAGEYVSVWLSGSFVRSSSVRWFSGYLISDDT